MMTPTEAAALLTLCAGYDNRKPDADTAKAWALALDDLRYVDCRDAVIAHYRASSDWIMPAKIREHVRRIRSKRIADAGDLCPPPGLNEPQEREWLGWARSQVADGAGVPPDPRQLVQRDVRALLTHAGDYADPTTGGAA